MFTEGFVNIWDNFNGSFCHKFDAGTLPEVEKAWVKEHPNDCVWSIGTEFAVVNKRENINNVYTGMGMNVGTVFLMIVFL